MREVIDLLIAHHVPWIILAFLAIALWPQIYDRWSERRRSKVKTAAELRAELQEVERKAAALIEQMRSEGQSGKKLSTTPTKD